MIERKRCGRGVPACLSGGPDWSDCSYCVARRLDFAIGTSWETGRVASWRTVQRMLSGIVETERDLAAR